MMMNRLVPTVLILFLAAGCYSGDPNLDVSAPAEPTRSLAPSPTAASSETTPPSPPVVVALPSWDVAGQCGVDRWAVKVGTDSDAVNIAKDAQVATLNVLAQIAAPPAVTSALPRQAVERQTFQVSATLVQAKRESDSDYHLVLSEAGHTLVAEMPHPSCAKGSVLINQLTTARAAFDARFPQLQGRRSWVQLGVPVTVTGVAFFDDAHGQTGEASNVLELHPLLSLR